MAHKSSLSEEDIKNTIVLPILQDIGFKDDELSFEDRFTLRLGHTTYDKNDQKRGYSDILCKSPDKLHNYFIVEVKKDGLTLTEDDKEQAITYARLVHPIAPFTIVTNGPDTKIYDTISKNEIDKNNYVQLSKRNVTIDLASQIECRHEAMCKLIGYNNKNIATFSEVQQEKRMSTLIGDKNNNDRKFIPDVYCDPPGLNDVFNEFLNSTDSVFLIIGDQGVGKTNAVCNLAKVSKAEHISFFYQGHTITKNLFELIKDDCNLFFSTQLNQFEVIKRLNGFTSENRQLIIFVDAVDEVSLPDFTKLLDEFVLQLSDFNNLKIVLSSKTQTYLRLITNYGVPTKISEKLFKSNTLTDTSRNRENYSFRINLFNETDFNACYEKYASFFGFTGELPPAIREELHRGIALKVFALVFENTEIEPSVSFNHLFTKYLEKVLEKSGEGQVRSRNEKLLEKLGEQILNENLTGNHNHFAIEYVDEEECRNALELKITELWPQELLDYNIFEIITDVTGIRKIGFYYSFIRDFIIIDRVLKIFSLDEIDFGRKIAELSEYDLGKELVYVTYLLSDQNYKSYLTKMFIEKISGFAEQYVAYFNQNQIVQSQPQMVRMTNPLGFVFGPLENPFNLIMLQRSDDEDLARIFIDGNEYKKLIDTRIIYRIQRGGPYFLTVDPDKYAKEYFLNDCLDILQKGNLDENNCLNLKNELIFAIIDYNREIFNFPERKCELQIPDADGILSLTLTDIKTKIDNYYRKELLLDMSYENQLLFQSKFPMEEMKEPLLTLFDKKSLNQVASRMKKPGTSYIGIHDSYHRNFSLEFLLQLLQDYTEDILVSPVYPTYILPEHTSTQSTNEVGVIHKIKIAVLRQAYSPASLIDFVSKLFNNFLTDYKTVIESNFEGLKGEFNLYGMLPVKMLYTLDFEKNWVYYVFIAHTETKAELVQLADWGTYNNGKVRGQRLSELLMPSKAYPVFGRAPERISWRCPMRNFLYAWIERELREIIKKNNS